MLIRGFSLLEMLFSLLLTSMLLMSLMTFYPKFQLDILKLYQQNRLEDSVNQALSGLIKDIKRAGFIADTLDKVAGRAIEINSLNNCIIIRYDSSITGMWRNNIRDPKNSDIFVYRFYKNNLEYQVGVNHCKGTGWEKLFDNNEVKVHSLYIKQHNHYIVINMTASLKKHSSISYSVVRYVKTENQ